MPPRPASVPMNASVFFLYMGFSLHSKGTQGSEDFPARGNERGMKKELIAAELTQMVKRKKSDNFNLRQQYSGKKSQLELNSSFLFDG